MDTVGEPGGVNKYNDLCYGLQVQGNLFQFLAGTRNFSQLHSVQTDSDVPLNGHGGFLGGLKRPKREADYSSLSTAEVKVSYTPPLPHPPPWRVQGQIYLCTVWCSRIEFRVTRTYTSANLNQQAISFSLYMYDAFQLLTATGKIGPDVYSLKACNYHAYFILT